MLGCRLIITCASPPRRQRSARSRRTAVINPRIEATGLRLVLGHLEEDHLGSIDSVNRIIGECNSNDTVGIIQVLLQLLGYEIDAGHRRAAWIAYAQTMLIGPTSAPPDTLAGWPEGDR
jgi:hypothetical protein